MYTYILYVQTSNTQNTYKRLTSWTVALRGKPQSKRSTLGYSSAQFNVFFTQDITHETKCWLQSPPLGGVVIVGEGVTAQLHPLTQGQPLENHANQ